MMRGTIQLSSFTALLILPWIAHAQLFPGMPAPQPVRPEPTPQPALMSPANPTGPQSGAFSGSVPQGQVTPVEISLSLSDAIARGLQANLGLILSDQQTQAARAASLRARSNLLPNLTGAVSESAEQLNLAVFGFHLPGAPSVVGPFPIFEARASLATSLLDFSALAKFRAQHENERSARLSYQDARDIVVLAVTNLYLQALAGEAQVTTARAQLSTAEAVSQQATDLKNAGVVAGIDVLRANVERQTEQQRVIYYQNEWEKEKLRLARAIGMPIEQTFRLSDQIPYAPPPALTSEQALSQTYGQRSDYQSALAAVHASELALKSATAERYPALNFNATYGDIGQRIYDSHGTVTAVAEVRFPIFDSGRIRSDVLQAQSQLDQRRAQAESLREGIAYEVRTALLDIQAASDQVQVAQEGVNLSEQQLAQARDRFTAGVVNSLEVVQSQDAVAVANQNYINALYMYNSAKGALARALGSSEKNYRTLLGVQ